MKYRFAEFVADAERFELTRNGTAITLQPRALQVLLCLLRAEGRLVTRDTLIEDVWGGRAISESALSSQIKALRAALSDNGSDGRIIATVHGRGFRIEPQVELLSAEPNSAAGAVDTGASPKADGKSDKVGTEAGRKPTIAVLPFATESEDPALAALAQGLPDEIIVSLSQLGSLHVIARGSSFRLGSSDLTGAAVREKLGAQYALGGMVRLEGERLEVAAELVDTATGDCVWTEEMRTQMRGVHELREEIVMQIVSRVEFAIPQHEIERIRLISPDQLTAWQAYHAGMGHIFRNSGDQMLRAETLFRRALKIDSDFARAHTGLAHVYWWRTIQRTLTDTADLARRLKASARAAVEADPLDSASLLAMGRAEGLLTDPEAGLEWTDKALHLSPNHAWAYSQSAAIRSFLRPDLAVDHARQALALSPQDPYRHSACAALAVAEVHRGNIQDAAHWGRAAMENHHNDLMVSITAMGTNFLAGNAEFAGKVADRIRKSHPDVTIDGVARANPMMTPEQIAGMRAMMTANGFS